MGREALAAPLQPLFKWPGGKRWLASTLAQAIPATMPYIEPFCGSAALFFEYLPSTAWLSDTNWQLINAFEVVRDYPVQLASRLKAMPVEPEYYDATARSTPADLVGHAARFVYLNKTSFGGIWRENQAGEFNVPFNKQLNSSLPTEETLLRAAGVLQSASLEHCGFEKALAAAPAGAVIYCDPPYGRSAPEVQFNRYTSIPYSDDDHRLLAGLLWEMCRDRLIIVSLPADPFLINMYDSNSFGVFQMDRATGLGYRGRRRASRVEVLLVSAPELFEGELTKKGWRRYAA